MATWDVKLATGQMLTVTLDELDQAFESGAIGADTMIRETGTEAWSTLNDAANLDATDECEVLAIHEPAVAAAAAPPVPAPVVMAHAAPPALPAAPTTLAPVQFDLLAADLVDDEDDDDMPEPSFFASVMARRPRAARVVLGVCSACALIITAALAVGSPTSSYAAASAPAAMSLRAERAPVVAPPVAPPPAQEVAAVTTPAPAAQARHTKAAPAKAKAAAPAAKTTKARPNAFAAKLGKR